MLPPEGWRLEAELYSPPLLRMAIAVYREQRVALDPAVLRNNPGRALRAASRRNSLETVLVMKPTENRLRGHAMIARDPMSR
jgi:hypothetical protein